MNLSVGIVGLPNVGKSTLFNALLKKQQALAANYPFATIEPNVGMVPVPDERLKVLADIVAGIPPTPGESWLHSVQPATPGVSSRRPPVVPATVKFVDIAGLVKGASEGAGLGNKFLAHIREVSIIAQVVRVFEDPNVIREGSVDVKSDYETVNAELMLADLQSLENSKRKTQSAKPQLKTQNLAIEKVLQNLNRGIPVRDIQLSEEEGETIKPLFLLTAKPETIVLNVSEEDYTEEKIHKIIEEYSSYLRSNNMAGNDDGDNIIVICAKIEAELAELSEEEQKEYLANLGLKESGLERLIKKAYETLGLISFLTAGEKEVRAWTLRAGSTALRASSVIHTDFEKNFIKAEVVSFEDFVKNKGWKGVREAGKARFEGRDYVMQDGDVVEFKIGT